VKCIDGQSLCEVEQLISGLISYLPNLTFNGHIEIQYGGNTSSRNPMFNRLLFFTILPMIHEHIYLLNVGKKPGKIKKKEFWKELQ
jgi:hypothetical protein